MTAADLLRDLMACAFPSFVTGIGAGYVFALCSNRRHRR